MIYSAVKKTKDEQTRTAFRSRSRLCFYGAGLVFAGTAPKEPLPQVDKLSPAAQLKAEDQYNRRRINYSRQNPNL